MVASYKSVLIFEANFQKFYIFPNMHDYFLFLAFLYDNICLICFLKYSFYLKWELS